MPITIVDDLIRHMEVETDNLLRADSDEIHLLIADLDAFDTVVAMEHFVLTRTQGLPNQRFTYHFTATDGRDWNQELRAAGAQQSEPTMNFSITDFWRLSEFSLHRPIRDRLVAWVDTYGLINLDHEWK